MKKWEDLTRDDFIRLTIVEGLHDFEIAKKFGVTEGRDTQNK